MIINEIKKLAGIKAPTRAYTPKELENEISEVKQSSEKEIPKGIKKIIIEKLKNVNSIPITWLPISTKVENTEAFGKKLKLEDIEKAFSSDKEYLNIFKKILNAKSFPPPIIAEFNGKKRLIGGNRRAVAMNIKREDNKIPTIYIKV